MTYGYDKSGFMQHNDDWIDLDISLIHQTWRSGWGASIQSDMLRKTIELSPRFTDRLKEEIFLQAIEFLRTLSSHQNTESFSQETIALIESFKGQASGDLIRKTGLAWNCSLLKKLVTGPRHNELVQVLDRKFVRYALSFDKTATHFPSAENQNADLAQLSDKIEQDGLKCLLCWLRDFPKDVSKKLIILLPKTEVTADDLKDFDRPAVKKIMHYVLNNNI